MSKKSSERSRTERAQAVLQARQAQERRRRLVAVGVVVLALVAVVVVGVLLTSRADTTGEVADATPAGVSDDYAVVVGEADAPSTITAYEDLQCPACATFEAQTADVVAEAVDAGEVQVEYHLVAFLDQASTTDYSSRALNALMVVLDTAGEDAFTEMHRLLYENQPPEGTAGLDDDQLVDYAVEAGASEDDVRGPIEDEKFAQWVVNATGQMSRDGVNGTPTVLIDDEPVEGDPAAAVLELLG